MNILDKLTKIEKLSAIALSAIVGFTLLTLNVFSTEPASFLGGNIVEGKNVTMGDAAYKDPVTGSASDRMRLRLQVINQGSENAQNTVASFDLTSGVSPLGKITANNASTVSDIVSIVPGGDHLKYVSGSALKYGQDCPSGCSISDSIVSGGVSLGTVYPSEDGGGYQISIEADLIGQPSLEDIPVFRKGDIYDGGNRSQGTVDWEDPIPANKGDLIEFRIFVANDGSVTAENVVVRAELPYQFTNNYVSTAHISGALAQPVSDTATVIINGAPQTLIYEPGHAQKFGPGCSKGCALPEGIAEMGINIGSVAVGEANSVQVVFKAYTSNVPGQSPTPTPTPTVSPTPTPTGTPTVTPTPTATPSGTPSSTPAPVLGASTPPKLPETGGSPFNPLTILASTTLGIALIRKFRLI